MKIRWFLHWKYLDFHYYRISYRKYRKFFENPWVFKRTFPPKLCVGRDGSVSMMSKKYKYNVVCFQFEYFPLPLLRFIQSQKSFSRSGVTSKYLEFPYENTMISITIGFPIEIHEIFIFWKSVSLQTHRSPKTMCREWWQCQYDV